MPRVTFLPAGVTVTCEQGESLFTVGQRARIPIETTCVGKATCGLCRVRVVSGEESLSELNDHERKHLGNVYFLTKVRLSCQAIVRGEEVTVELAPKRVRARTGRS